MSFEKLLADLEDLQALQKSAPADEGESSEGGADDQNIAAAAADGEAAGAAGDGDGDEGAGAGAGDGDGDEGGADEPMGKSFRFQLDSGEEIEAVDGTELVKSLMSRFDALEGAAVQKEEAMTKAMGMVLDLVKSQGAQIASLQGDLKRLGNEGRGRKAVVSVAEKPAATDMQKSEPAGVSGEEFMAKCLSAQAAGRITALDVSKAEGYLLKGLAVPADIVKRVLV